MAIKLSTSVKNGMLDAIETAIGTSAVLKIRTGSAPAGIADADLMIDSSSTVGGVPTVWLSGGTAGEAYVVRCRIVTSDGRTDDRSIVVQVRDR